MVNLEQIEIDRNIALSKGITFTISKKEKKGAPWQDLEVDCKDLVKAFQISKDVECFDVAIFAAYKAGGVFYWSSRDPELLNSKALTRENG